MVEVGTRVFMKGLKAKIMLSKKKSFKKDIQIQIGNPK